MDLQTLADLGEFVSGVAVIASLVYLAVQLRHNTHSLQAENYARALDRVANMQALMSQNAEFASLFSRGALDPAALSPAERIRFTWWGYEAFGAFEFMFHQAQARAIPDEVWARWSETTCWWLSFPGVRAWWASKPAPFSASFSAFIDARIREGALETEGTRRWQEFVRTGRLAAAPLVASPQPREGGDS